MKQSITVGAILFCLILSCQPVQPPDSLQRSLTLAGENRKEIMMAIRHYSQNAKDSLKLKALYFLIENMDGWYYYKGPLLNHYLEYLKLIKADSEHGAEFMQNIRSKYGPYSSNGVQLLYDLQQVKAKELIENIEMAFKVWKEQPWGKSISFPHFCEYILPFRISDEVPADNRRAIYDQFNSYLDSVKRAGGSTIEACKVINDRLIEDKWLFTTKVGFLPHFDAARLVKYRTGSCRDMADLGTYVMRSLGIPVGNDFLPQWPYRNQGHNWNVVLVDEGEHTRMFLGAEDSPGTPHKPLTKKGKVYRRTYAKDPASLAMLKQPEDMVPLLFNDARIRDVTDSYVSCLDIRIPLEKLTCAGQKYAYICVFNNNRWVPIHWGSIEANQESVVFTKMETGISYIAAVYKNNNIIPASPPFILSEDGQLRYLVANRKSPNDRLTTSRIFPVTADDFYVGDLDGAIFQAAHNKDFSDAETLFTVPRHTFPYWNKFYPTTANSFRYYRCMLPPGNNCLGEMAVFKHGRKLSGRLMFPTDTIFKRPETNASKAFDNDFETGFSSYKERRGWVGIDLGKSVEPDSILYAAKIYLRPEIFIISGHEYELSVWSEGKWESLQRKKANSGIINFSRLPAGGLFLLNDITKPVNKRIFTIENGKQVWW